MIQFFKKTRDFDADQLMSWMSKHNQGKVEIAYNYDCQPRHLNSFVSLEKLKLPDGWYYNEKKGLTNNLITVRIFWL